MPKPFSPETLYDSLAAFPGGVNEGDTPLDLPLSVMAGAINTTVTGKNVTHRPPYVKKQVIWFSPLDEASFEGGYFQGCTTKLCKSDSGVSSVVCLVNGDVYQFVITDTTVTAYHIPLASIPFTGPFPVQPQAWLWQAERWVIITDGKNPTAWFDLDLQTVSQSQYGQGISIGNSTTTTTGFTPTGTPPPGVVATIDVADASLITLGTIIAINGPRGALYGSFQVTAITSDTLTVISIGDVRAVQAVGLDPPTGSSVTWNTPSTSPNLPPGRQGLYWLGRIWMALVNGTSFVASDIVYGPSGTKTYGFRDSILNITENNFIVGGGNFTVPGGAGAITAMVGVSTADVSLGQGPIFISTQNLVFSCQAPVDRLTWQNINNPILTVALVGNGAMGQNSTVQVNGDILYRSVDGIRSLIQNTLDFNTWGRTPQSFEVSPILALDDPGQLQYGSAIVFSNRMLMSVGTVANDLTAQPQTGKGTYFRGLIPLNLDPISSLRGKAPAVYDSGVWTGINVLQLTVGQVNLVERAFAFVYNATPGSTGIEFWELLSDDEASRAFPPIIADNNGSGDVPITWQFDSASMRFGVPPKDRKYMHLSNGEIYVDDLIGTVSFQVQYKADLFPCWTNWWAWQSCQTSDATDSQPGFLPRQGLGEPSASPCDLSAGRPLRNGFTFQVRHIIQGHLIFRGAWFEAETEPMPKFARAVCGCGPAPLPTPPFTKLPQWVFSGIGSPVGVIMPQVPVAFYFDKTIRLQPIIWYYADGVWTRFIG